MSLDARYPVIIDDTEALLRRSFPHNRVGRVRADGDSTAILSVYRGHRRYARRVRLCRREDVTLLLQHVGTKKPLEAIP